MKVIRNQEVIINTVNEYQIGDQIKVGKYTATCQKVTPNGAIFMLDQYLDKLYKMNSMLTNNGGYEESDLRQDIRKDFTHDPEFDDIRDKVIPFENGDLVRIPTIGELFGKHNECNDEFIFAMRHKAEYVMDNADQWELMKKRKNRIATRDGSVYDWGWLQNVAKESTTGFASINHYGSLRRNFYASVSMGVRPVFMLGA